jgi:threonine/homoserine/homoserine lactone efflux protein
MHEISALIGIAVALAIGAMSPGPSFVMVARTAASSNRLNGLSAALGMGMGGLLFAIISLLGLQSLLLAVPTLYIVLKVAGGLYLAYLGVKIWRGANHSLSTKSDGQQQAGSSLLRHFTLGFATQLSNPKTAIVYASVFAAFLPSEQSFQFSASVIALVFIVEAGWYSLVALLLSTEAPRKSYLRYKSWVDRAAGGVMIALGLKLASSAGNH